MYRKQLDTCVLYSWAQV